MLQITPFTSRVLDIVAGPYADAVSQIWAGPRAAEYLTAPDLRRHVWHACLASPFGMFIVARDGAELLYARMTAMKSRDLIVQAYGARPPGVLGVMRRLGPAPRNPDIYQLLIAAMEQGGVGARQLMHHPAPTDAWIETIAALPPTISKHTTAMLGRYPYSDPEDLALFVWTVERLQAIGNEPCYRSLLASNDPVTALQAALMTRPFPPFPWRGTPRLTPLTTVAEITRVASEFNNCLQPGHGHRDIMKIFNGTKYFYHWTGDEQAIIELIAVGGVGWFVRDARGPNNESISLRTRRTIARTFAQTDNICPVRLTVRDSVYPCGLFWGEIAGGQ